MTNKTEYILANENKTKSLAKKISRIAKEGDVFALYGTLGMGKSVFARAFIQELCGESGVSGGRTHQQYHQQHSKKYRAGY